MRVPAWLIAVVLVCGCASMTNGQNRENVGDEQQRSQAPPQEILKKTAGLRRIDTAIATIETELERARTEAKKAGEEDDPAFELLIREAENRLISLRSSFTQIASGVDEPPFGPRDDLKEFEWEQELKTLLNPLLGELKRLTQRPRELDQLRTECNLLRRQIETARKGLSNIDTLLAVQTESLAEEAEALAERLQGEQRRWQSQLESLETNLTVVEQKLAAKEAEAATFSESVGHISDLFFRSRARNLIVALLGLIGFILIGRLILRRLQATTYYVRNRRTFRIRLLNIFFLIGNTIGGVVTFLTILVLFSDWVLLTLSILFLIGALWTWKQALARFWDQITLLLNIGPVREGERVHYQGLPWQVRSINFYSYLVNPDLQGGTLRLPLHDLLDMRSRPAHQDEPWFPTREHDWVLLEDQLLRVTLQSPEVVKLVALGNATRSIPTGDFLEMTPVVLTTGFRISFGFGLDYDLQAAVTEAVPQQMHAAMSRYLDQRKPDLLEQLRLQVDFGEAADSSLNLAVIVDFPGDYAKDYQRMRRLLQEACVAACTEHGWSIPFPQLTVHSTSGNQPPEDEIGDGG